MSTNTAITANLTEIYFLRYNRYVNYETTYFDFTLHRICGTGNCTVYFSRFQSDDCSEGWPCDSYPAWVKENYERRFVISDDEPRNVTLQHP